PRRSRRTWWPRRSRISRAWWPRRTGGPGRTATAAVRPTRFLRPPWTPDGRPQGRAPRIQRARSRGAALAPGARIRLERRASPRCSAAILGRTAASRWLGRASASWWLERPMERAGARCRNRAAWFPGVELRRVQRDCGFHPAVRRLGVLAVRSVDSAVLT